MNRTSARKLFYLFSIWFRSVPKVVVFAFSHSQCSQLFIWRHSLAFIVFWLSTFDSIGESMVGLPHIPVNIHNVRWMNVCVCVSWVCDEYVCMYLCVSSVYLHNREIENVRSTTLFFFAFRYFFCFEIAPT